MALRYAEVILGINAPAVVELISKIDEASGVVVPMPTCAKEKTENRQKMNKTNGALLFMSNFGVNQH